jgi:hypothetical protein
LLQRNASQSITPPRVVFVGLDENIAEKYRALISEALSDLHLTVDTLLLRDLERDADAALDSLEPIRCLVSLAVTFPDLRRFAGHRGTPLFGLVVELTEETQHTLVHLPVDVPIGLVAESRYVPSARALLRLYLGDLDRVQWTVPRKGPALQRLLRECPIVTHTFGSKKLLRSMDTHGVQLVELEYRLNAASLSRLRTVLTTDESADGVSPKSARNGTSNHAATARA